MCEPPCEKACHMSLRILTRPDRNQSALLLKLTTSLKFRAHYANKPMHYAEIFIKISFDRNLSDSVSIERKERKDEKFEYFLIFAQTLIVGTRCEAVLTSTHNLCLRAKIRK